MAKITGSGCMLSSLCAAFLAANKDTPLEAAAAATAAMGLCGEKAYMRMAREEAGNSTCRNYLIDEMYKMTGEKLEKGARYEFC